MSDTLIPLIVRPSGVWNSRAPLHNYVLERRALSKATCVLTLAIYALRHNASKEPDRNRSGRQFLAGIVKTEIVAGEAWVDYRRSHNKQADGKHPQPTVDQLATDAMRSVYDVREMTIVRLSSLFESFAQCWAINYLIGKLEADLELNAGEQRLVRMFNPILSGGHLPGWPKITASLPALERGLSRIPHVRRLSNGSLVSAPIMKDVNAFTVIRFWREFRNLSVHTGRAVTRPFYARYQEFFARMMDGMQHLPGRLLPGKPMPLHDDMHSAMAAVQYRAAEWMNEQLLELTAARRGHPDAPSAVVRTYFEITPPTPPFLLASDHEPSWLWSSDTQFREALSRREGWKLQ
jgi:hypothetical protein